MLKKIFKNRIKLFKNSQYLDPKLRIFNEKYGHHLSVKLKSSVNEKNESLPWFTYPAIEFLDQLNLTQADIFEWGSGNSSKYFSKKCKSIISIEHDLNWYEIQKNDLKNNQQLIHVDKSLYDKVISEKNKEYDIIIIDGILRGLCLQSAFNFIKLDGMIIYDNSDRDPQNCLILREKGFTQIDFSGFGPINDYTWTTSIFFKHFKFKPLTIQPIIPIGGGY
jgi:hypothetical protein